MTIFTEPLKNTSTMKKLFLFSLFVVFSAVLFSCGGTAGAAENAKGFFNAMARKDYDGAKQYSAKSAHMVLDGLKAKELFGGMLNKGDNKETVAAEAKEVNCEKNPDNKIICTVCCDAKGKSQRLEMVEEGGKQVVSPSMVDMLIKELLPALN